MAQTVKHLPTMQETRVLSLGREVPLEKEMATHSNILAWKIPWMEEPGRLQSTGSQRVDKNYLSRIKAYMKVKVTQSCPTLCNPMGYRLHGILQAKILDWVAFPFSRMVITDS